jgi:aryl-alcohol dehydrogenase-like predicted oxidoreductase
MIEKRNLAKKGPAVGCLGYGAMVLEGYYGASNDDQAVETIHRALDVGMTIVPIPGTRRPERVNENAKASAIKLDSATLQRINELARPGLAQGVTLV